METSNVGVESWLWLFLAETFSLSDPDPISELGIRRVVVIPTSYGPTSHEKQRTSGGLGLLPLSFKGRKCSFYTARTLCLLWWTSSVGRGSGSI